MSEDKERRANDAFSRGTEAMLQQDWGNCCTLFGLCVELAPENLLYRQALRGATERKFGNKREAASIPDTVRKQLQASIQRALLRRDWNEVAARCEEGLALDPWNAWLSAHLGDALDEMGIVDGAVFSYERAYQGARNREDYLLRLSELYERRGKYERAIECLKKLGRLDDATMHRLDELIEKAKACPPADDRRVIAAHMSRDRSIEDLNQTIDRNPFEIENYLKLAYRLKDASNLDEAVAVLERAYERSGREVWVREIWDELELERLKHALSYAKARSQIEPDDEIAQGKYQFQKDLLEEKERAILCRSPSHIEKLGNSFGKYDQAIQCIAKKHLREAIPLLFIARGEPTLRLKSLVALGKCFIFTRQFDLAQRQFELALAETGQDQDPDVLLELRYFLNRLRRDPPDIDPGCPVPRKR